MTHGRGLWVVVLAASVGVTVFAQTAGGAGEVYTCVDKNGKKLTSDRLIPECSDREQRVLDATGAERRRIGPSLTEHERSAQEAQRRKQAQEKARVIAERRAERVLITRYPDQAAHQAEREQALVQVDEVIAVARKRITDLRTDRKTLDEELQFYSGALYKAPVKLQRQFADNDQAIEEQERFIAAQRQEKQRINERFDAELVKLRVLWAQQRAAQETLQTPVVTKP